MTVNSENACKFIMNRFENSKNAAIFFAKNSEKISVSVNAAEKLRHTENIKNVLIICPESRIRIWQKAFAKLAKFDYELKIFNRKSQKSLNFFKNANCFKLQIAVAEYESLCKFEKEISSLTPEFMIADESYMISDYSFKARKTAHRISKKIKHKMILTNSLKFNDCTNIFWQYKILDSNIFGNDFHYFQNKYYEPIDYHNPVSEIKKSAETEFKQKIFEPVF